MKKMLWISKKINQRYQKSTRNFSIGMILSSIMVLLLISISIATNQIFSQISEDNLDAKEIRIFNTKKDDFGNTIPTEIDNQLLVSMNSHPDIDQIVHQTQLLGESYFIGIDGHDIQAGSYVNGIDVDYHSFTKKERSNLTSNVMNSPIISGRDFESLDTKKALVDENFAISIGYEQVSSILGKTFTLSMGTVDIMQIEIIGVYTYQLGTVPTFLMSYNLVDFQNDILVYGYNSPFIYSDDIIQEMRLLVTDETTYNERAIIDVKYIKRVINVYEWIDGQVDNTLSSILQETQKMVDQMSIVIILLSMVIIAIVLISLLSIISHTVAKLIAQRHFLRMLILMGYSFKQIILIYTLELLYVMMKIIVIYTTITYLFSLIIEFLLKPSYQVLVPSLNNVFILAPIYWASYTLSIIILTSSMIMSITAVTLIRFNRKKAYLQ